jgi:hypothetical protein
VDKAKGSIMISRFSFYRFSFVGMIVCAVLLFSACDEPKTGDLRGTWLSEYDGYTIDTSMLSYDDRYSPFTGTIKNSPDFSAQSGVIIIEYVEPSSDSQAGYFTAVYWRELTEDSVLLANALDLDTSTLDKWDTLQTTSLEEAQNKFTIAKVNDFVSVWGAYHQQ